jgi:hypothetical protein
MVSQEYPEYKESIMYRTWMVSALVAYSSFTHASAAYYGTGLCGYPQYECIRVGKGQSWERLFPDPVQRDLVQRLNRMSNPIWSGKDIAVPKDLEHATMASLSPFPLTVPNEGVQLVIVDQDKLAYAAYDKTGHLVMWGPIASGRDRCPDAAKSCRTMTGVFYFFSKENEHCRSNVYPLGKGGAKMPYCMYFHKGFALHGSSDIPGYRASHGCIRLFTRDAKWLNEHFVTTTNEDRGEIGTKVIVRPVLSSDTGKPQ